MGQVSYVKQTTDSWLTTHLPERDFTAPVIPERDLIEARAKQTQSTGSHPLWEGYNKGDGITRTSNNVRTSEGIGCFFSWLVKQKKALTIVEFGSAFGVSGMYWLSGVNSVPGSHLFSFEPNEIWAKFAEENFAAVSTNHTLTRGTFESNVEAVLAGRQIDIAFIDAIHTSEFVLPQFEIVKRHAAPGALVVFDDIGFSSDMTNCWNKVAQMSDVVSSATFGKRLGLTELG